MPGGSDRDPARQLKVPPSRTDRRSTSNSPIPPSKVPAQSPIGTRSQIQKQSVSTMALSDFTSLADRLSQFEAKLSTASIAEEDVYALEIRRNRITSLWEKVDDEYGRCSKVLSKSSTSTEAQALESRFDSCYMVYERSLAKLNRLIDQASTSSSKSQPDPKFSSDLDGCRIPPCDTEVFHGDYLQWPTFRDLFSAIYGNNPRLTQVEKLFHLNAKTGGEAKKLVAKSRLTHSGFESAWNALTKRYENKRKIVNSQLKLLSCVVAVLLG